MIVYIHGGGFYAGASNNYGPDFLLDHDVVLVTMNYRLGPFGFLSLGSDAYPGNNGLKDQLMAMRWVNENIGHFGGDANKVTIYGWSAGCWSASLHSVSPASQGLFQRVMCFGASGMVPWMLSSVPNHRTIAQDYANSNGVHPDGDRELVDYLKRVHSEGIAQMAYTDFFTAGTSKKAIELPWTLVIEPPGASNPFMQRSPEEYYLEENYPAGHIDFLIGYADGEAYSAISTDLNQPSLLEPFNESFVIQLPLLGCHYSYDDPVSFFGI